MSYVPFYELLPDIAFDETRTITLTKNFNSLPPGDYALYEMYCDDMKCDCRKVIISVTSKQLKKTLAYIAFGWESKYFYARKLDMGTQGNRFTKSEQAMLKEAKGPCLNSMSPQSKYAPDILELVSIHILEDKAYVDRLKRHYVLFKKKLREKNKRGDKT